MDPLHILALMMRSANGDEEAAEELRKESCQGLVHAVHGVEKLTGLRIEPGSFLLGMAFEAHNGLNCFMDPDHREELTKNAEMAREIYAEEATSES